MQSLANTFMNNNPKEVKKSLLSWLAAAKQQAALPVGCYSPFGQTRSSVWMGGIPEF